MQLNIHLNIPPFLEGRQQLSEGEVTKGRQISSLRIHVERAIGRMKSFPVCKDTIPITLARLANQIVHVWAFLTNFQPALVPQAASSEEVVDSDLDDYFDCLSEEDEEPD